MGVTDKLSGLYTLLEEKYYGVLDLLDDKGIPIYGYADFLEDKGIPSFPVTIALIVILIALFSGIFVIGNTIETTLAFNITDQFDDAVTQISFSVEDDFGNDLTSGTVGNGTDFTLPPLPVGTRITLIFEKDGYDRETRDISANQKNKTVNVGMSRTINLITAHLKLVDQETDDTVHKADVLLKVNGNDHRGVKNGVGVWSFNAIPANQNIRVQVTADAYEVIDQTLQFFDGETKNVTLTPKVSHFSGDTSKLIVTIKDPSGNLVKDASVKLKNRGTGDDSLAEGLAGDGEFIANLPTGTSVRLIVEKDGYVRYDCALLEDCRTLRTEEEQWTVTLSTGGTEITVRVLDDLTNTLDSANVSLYSLENQLIDSKITGLGGLAPFFNLDSTEEIYVTGYLDGYLPARLKLDIATKTDQDLVLESANFSNASPIAVYVTSTEGTIAHNVPVTFLERVGDDYLPLGVPVTRTDVSGFAKARARIGSTVQITAETDDAIGTEEITIVGNTVNEVNLHMRSKSNIVQINLFDGDGNPFSGNVRITSVDGAYITDQDVTDGKVFFDADDYEYVNVTLTDEEGNTHTEQIRVKDEQEVSMHMGKKEERDASLTPSVEFLGIVDERGNGVEGITPDEQFWAEFNVVFEQDTPAGGLHVRVGPDTARFVDSQEIGIQGYDGVAEDVVYGRSFQPAPAPGNESADIQNKGNPGEFNKYIDVLFENPAGSNTVRIKLKARETIQTDTIQLHYRAWSEFNGDYYRNPLDTTLGTKRFTQEKTGLYADVVSQEIEVFDNNPECRDGVCISYRFFDAQTGIAHLPQEFRSVSDSLYALEIGVRPQITVQSASINVDTSQRTPRITFTGFEIDGFRPNLQGEIPAASGFLGSEIVPINLPTIDGGFEIPIENPDAESEENSIPTVEDTTPTDDGTFSGDIPQRASFQEVTQPGFIDQSQPDDSGIETITGGFVGESFGAADPGLVALQQSENPLGFNDRNDEDPIRTSINVEGFALQKGEHTNARVDFKTLGTPGIGIITTNIVINGKPIQKQFKFIISKKRRLEIEIVPEEVELGEDYSINITDRETGKGINNATIRIEDDTGEIVESTVGDNTQQNGDGGVYRFKNALDLGEYTVKAQAENYQPEEESFLIRKEGVLRIDEEITIKIARNETEKTVTADLENTSNLEIANLSFEIEELGDFPEIFDVDVRVPQRIGGDDAERVSITVTLDEDANRADTVHGELDITFTGEILGRYTSSTKTRALVDYNKKLDSSCLQFNKKQLRIRLNGNENPQLYNNQYGSYPNGYNPQGGFGGNQFGNQRGINPQNSANGYQYNSQYPNSNQYSYNNVYNQGGYPNQGNYQSNSVFNPTQAYPQQNNYFNQLPYGQYSNDPQQYYNQNLRPGQDFFEVKNDCGVDVTLQSNVIRKSNDPNLFIKVQEGSPNQSFSFFTQPQNITKSVRIKDGETETVVVSASNSINRFFDLSGQFQFEILLDSPEVSKSIPLTVELVNPRFFLQYPQSLVFHLSTQQGQNPSYYPQGGTQPNRGFLQAQTFTPAPGTIFFQEDPVNPSDPITENPTNTATSPGTGIRTPLQEPENFNAAGRQLTTGGFVGEARDVQPLLVANTGAEPIVGFNVAIDDTGYRVHGITAQIEPPVFGALSLFPGQPISPARFVVATVNSQRALNTPTQGLITYFGTVQGRQQNFGQTALFFNYAGQDCLVAEPVDDLVFNQQAVGLGTGIAKRVRVTNQCGVAVQVLGLDQREYQGNPIGLLFPTHGATLAPGASSDTFQLQFISQQETRGEARVRIVGLLGPPSQQEIKSNELTLNINVGSQSLPPEPINAQGNPVEVEVCEEPDTKMTITLPKFSAQCNDGYCDAVQFSDHLMKKIESVVKEAQGKADAAACERNKNYCTFGQVGVRLNEFFGALQGGDFSSQLLLEQRGKKVAGLRVGLVRTQQTISDITAIAGTGFAPGDIIIGQQLKGCGAYQLSIDGAFRTINGEIQKNEWVVIVKVVNKQVTQGCAEKIWNVMNFLPVDKGLTAGDYPKAWPGLVGHDSGTKNVADQVAAGLYPGEKARSVTNRQNANIIKIVKGDTKDAIVRIRIEAQNNSGQNPRTVFVHVPDTYTEEVTGRANTAFTNGTTLQLQNSEKGGFVITNFNGFYLQTQTAFEFDDFKKGLSAKNTQTGNPGKLDAAQLVNQQVGIKIFGNVGEQYTVMLSLPGYEAISLTSDPVAINGKSSNLSINWERLHATSTGSSTSTGDTTTAGSPTGRPSGGTDSITTGSGTGSTSTDTASPELRTSSNIAKEAGKAIADLRSGIINGCVTRDGLEIWIKELSDESILGKLKIDGSSANEIKITSGLQCVPFTVNSSLDERVEIVTNFKGKSSKGSIEKIIIREPGVENKTGIFLEELSNSNTSGKNQIALERRRVTSGRGESGFVFTKELELCVDGSERFPNAPSEINNLGIKARSLRINNRESAEHDVAVKVCGIHPYTLLDELGEKGNGVYYATIGWDDAPEELEINHVRIVTSAFFEGNGKKALEDQEDVADGVAADTLAGQSKYQAKVDDHILNGIGYYLGACIPVSVAGAIGTGGWGLAIAPILDCGFPALAVFGRHTSGGRTASDFLSQFFPEWAVHFLLGDSGEDIRPDLDPNNITDQQTEKQFKDEILPRAIAGTLADSLRRSVRVGPAIANVTTEAKAADELTQRFYERLFTRTSDLTVRRDLVAKIDIENIIIKELEKARLQAGTNLGVLETLRGGRITIDDALKAAEGGISQEVTTRAKTLSQSTFEKLLKNDFTELEKTIGERIVPPNLASQSYDSIERIREIHNRPNTSTIVDIQKEVAGQVRADLARNMRSTLEKTFGKAWTDMTFPDQSGLLQKMSDRIETAIPDSRIKVTNVGKSFEPIWRVVIDDDLLKQAADDGATAIRTHVSDPAFKTFIQNTIAKDDVVNKVTSLLQEDVTNASKAPIEKGRFKQWLENFTAAGKLKFFAKLGYGIGAGFLANYFGFQAYKYFRETNSINPNAKKMEEVVDKIDPKTGKQVVGGGDDNGNTNVVKGGSWKKFNTYRFLVTDTGTQFKLLKSQSDFDRMDKELSSKKALLLEEDCDAFAQQGVTRTLGGLAPRFDATKSDLIRDFIPEYYTNNSEFAQAVKQHSVNEAQLVALMTHKPGNIKACAGKVDVLNTNTSHHEIDCVAKAFVANGRKLPGLTNLTGSAETAYQTEMQKRMTVWSRVPTLVSRGR